MIIKNYSLSTLKPTKSITIAIFSDLHFSNNFNFNKLNKLKEQLILKKPNYICIPGDIIISTNILDNKEIKKQILDFFKSIGNIAPTFISLGNHDYIKIIDRKKYEDKNKFWYNEFKKLRKHNVYLLDNEIFEDKNIRFIGYTLSYKYYNNNESTEILIKDLKNNIKNINNDKFNILLCHSPIKILNNKVIDNIEYLKNLDLVISGHMHNGLVPIILDKIFPKNRGFIAPNKTLFPDNARGIKKISINNKKITLIISGGITKIQESNSKILKICSNFYSPQIEYIEIKNK